jgi:aminoglycoside phosphotransferase (APT) family kinase protein
MIDDGVHYGAVFEMLNAESYASLLIDGEKTVDEIAEMTAETLHSVHNAVPEEGFLPDKREEYLGKIDDFRDCIPEEQSEKILSMLKAMPYDPHMIHGDFHIKNIMVQNGESLIIDMDTLAVGDPVFEFAAMYAAYLGFSEADPDNVMEFFGISKETVTELWKATLRAYFGNEADAEAADKKIRLTAAVFMLSFMIRHTEREENFRSRLIEMNIKNIDRLIGEVDGLAIRKD